MKRKQIIRISSSVLILLSALGIIMVSLMAFQNPQAVMDLVQVQLNNNDAFSSIRGVYGGAGITIVIALIYLLIKNKPLGLVLAGILWGSYAISRMITIAVEGPLGAFGQQWLKIESVLCVLCFCVYFIGRKTEAVK